MTDAPHRPSREELDDLFRDDNLWEHARRVATALTLTEGKRGPAFESDQMLEQRILSLYTRGGLTDDKLVFYYQRNAELASWTKLTRDQIIGYRDALAGKLWLLTAFDRNRKPGDPIIWVIAR